MDAACSSQAPYVKGIMDFLVIQYDSAEQFVKNFLYSNYGFCSPKADILQCQLVLISMPTDVESPSTVHHQQPVSSSG